MSMPQELKSVRPDDAAVITETGELDSRSMNTIRSLLGSDLEPANALKTAPSAVRPAAFEANDATMEDAAQMERVQAEGVQHRADQVTAYERAQAVQPAPRGQTVDDTAELAEALQAAEASAAHVPFGAEPVRKPEAFEHAAAPRARRELSLPFGLRLPLGFRPTRKHYVYGAIAALILFRPGLIIGAVLAILALFVGIFLILGYDGFWKKSMALGYWYARRRPAHAEKLHARLDNFAVKWDAFLDRFPEGTVDGLYLPDFGELATADRRHEEAMNRRLSGIQETEA